MEAVGECLSVDEAKMAERERPVKVQPEHQPSSDVRDGHETDDPFEGWERYPATEADENIGYQKLAWYAAPFGTEGVTLLLVAAVVNGLRRAGRTLIRLIVR